MRYYFFCHYSSMSTVLLWLSVNEPHMGKHEILWKILYLIVDILSFVLLICNIKRMNLFLHCCYMYKVWMMANISCRFIIVDMSCDMAINCKQLKYGRGVIDCISTIFFFLFIIFRNIFLKSKFIWSFLETCNEIIWYFLEI